MGEVHRENHSPQNNEDVNESFKNEALKQAMEFADTVLKHINQGQELDEEVKEAIGGAIVLSCEIVYLLNNVKIAKGKFTEGTYFGKDVCVKTGSDLEYFFVYVGSAPDHDPSQYSAAANFVYKKRVNESGEIAYHISQMIVNVTDPTNVRLSHGSTILQHVAFKDVELGKLELLNYVKVPLDKNNKPDFSILTKRNNSDSKSKFIGRIKRHIGTPGILIPIKGFGEPKIEIHVIEYGEGPAVDHKYKVPPILVKKSWEECIPNKENAAFHFISQQMGQEINTHSAIKAYEEFKKVVERTKVVAKEVLGIVENIKDTNAWIKIGRYEGFILIDKHPNGSISSITIGQDPPNKMIARNYQPVVKFTYYKGRFLSSVKADESLPVNFGIINEGEFNEGEFKAHRSLKGPAKYVTMHENGKIIRNETIFKDGETTGVEPTVSQLPKGNIVARFINGRIHDKYQEMNK